MKKELMVAYGVADKLFPRMKHTCKDCDTCCKTYGWLLKEEAEKFIKRGYPIVGINKGLFCIDSFKRDKNSKRIINKIPKCLFYKNKRCIIHKNRPLDCRFYPLKIKFVKNRAFLGISLGCKYTSSKNKKQKQKLHKKINKYVKQIPKEILQEYIELMANVEKISKPKRFWMKKIIELKKKKNNWGLDFSHN